jgi:MFS family permease
VLLTLAAGQFVMALDTTVMNTAIATVAEDLDYTLVMAPLMIAGGKVGEIVGRKRAFTIGCVVQRVRVADDGAVTEPDGADDRLVGPSMAWARC